MLRLPEPGLFRRGRGPAPVRAHLGPPSPTPNTHTHLGPLHPRILEPPSRLCTGAPRRPPARAAYLARLPAPSLSQPRRPPAGDLPAPRPGCSAGSASRAALGAAASPWRPGGGGGGGLVARQATRRGSRGWPEVSRRDPKLGLGPGPQWYPSQGARQVRVQRDVRLAGAAAQGAEGARRWLP